MHGGSVAGVWIAVALAVSGCSLDRSAIAGAIDSGDVDPLDAGPGVDASITAADAFVPARDGSSCTPRCSGDVAVLCSPTGEAMFDCALADAICESNSGSARCTGGACDGLICSSDGISVLQCAAGIPASPMPCDRGCEAGACRPEVACAWDVIGRIRPGDTRMIDLCGTLDDATQTGCGGNDSTGEDVVFRLDVDHRATYRIEVRDADATRHVDPVLYVRKACDDESSQVTCDDDGGDTALDAREDITLDPGEYFLFADSFDWNDGPTMYRCGQVSVSIVER